MERRVQKIVVVEEIDNRKMKPINRKPLNNNNDKLNKFLDKMHEDTKAQYKNGILSLDDTSSV